MIKLGDIEIHLINDAIAMVDGGGAFGLVPRKLWQRYITPDEDNLVPMYQVNLLVRTPEKVIVVDTGLGTKLGERQKRFWGIQYHSGLPAALDALGLTVDDVDLVIDTHLHSDHCGGNTRFAEDGETVIPTFPRAKYVVQRREYEDASHPNERTRATYLPENFEPLRKSGQLELLNGDTEFAPGIVGRVTPGHTPGHMSVFFEHGGQHVAFLCDLATYAVHFERLGWMTAYDVEPLRTLETKRRWQQWAIDNRALLIFPHDSQRPAGYLRDGDGKNPTLEPVPVTFANKF